MRTLMRIHVSALATCAAIMLAATAAQGRIVELTFDDGPDGSGPSDDRAELDNLEARRASLGEEGWEAVLTGSARRSALGEGRYGRAADFPDGAGSIEISGRGGIDRVVATSMWVLARDVSAGHLLSLEGHFALALSGGALIIEVPDGSGGVVEHALGATFEADGAFHHVAIAVDASSGPPTFTVNVDFALAGQVEVATGPPPSEPVIRLGAGFAGMIDELLITGRLPSENDLFDFSPTYCPEGTSCLEEVITTTPRDFAHEVPVRFKSIYDPETCTASSPCPLLFDISGGNDCADDYAGVASVRRFVNAGFFVVTIDPYCEGDADTNPNPTETSQFVTVKDHILDSSPLSDLVAGPEYVASGCSHGAGAVLAWALHEEDYPVRTYPRSAGIDAHCALHAGALCPAVVEHNEQRIAEALGSHDDESAEIQAAFERGNTPSLLTADIVGSRELALSWGLNLEGEVCRPDGDFICNEEGQWGMTYGARRFRDVWQRLEAGPSPSGYFVEDHGADCRHCAAPGSGAFACGLCLLRHGRAGMEESCPECLSYDPPDIDPGALAEPCPIDASWYEDPLFAGGDGDADADGDGDIDADADGDGDAANDGDIDSDADARADAGGDGDVADDGSGSDGCSCAAPGRRSGRGALMLGALLLVAVRAARFR